MAGISNTEPFEFRRTSVLDFDLAVCSGVNAVDMNRLLNGRLDDFQEVLGDSGSTGDVMCGGVRYLGGCVLVLPWGKGRPVCAMPRSAKCFT